MDQQLIKYVKSKIEELNDLFKPLFNNVKWDEFFKHNSLSEDLITLNIDLFPDNFFIYLLCNQKLSEEFIERHIDKLRWDLISNHQDLSEEFIERHINNENFILNFALQHNNVSEEFIERNIEHLDRNYLWDVIFKCNKLSIKFIEKYFDKTDLTMISIYQDLPEEFIEKNIKLFDETDIKILTEYQKLSEEFIERHLNLFDIKLLIESQKLSEEFIERHKFMSYHRDFVYSLIKHQKLSEEFIERYFDNLSNSTNNYMLVIICRYQKLSDEFILKHLSDFKIMSLETICRFQTLLESTIEKISDSIGLSMFGCNPLWTLIAKHQKLSSEFIIKNKNRLSKQILYSNEFIDNEIIDSIYCDDDDNDNISISGFDFS